MRGVAAAATRGAGRKSVNWRSGRRRSCARRTRDVFALATEPRLI